MSEYERVRMLGRGASGTALLMRRARDGDLVVCKVISMQGLERPPAAPTAFQLEAAPATSSLSRGESHSSKFASTSAESSVKSVDGAGSGAGSAAAFLSNEVSILASLAHPHIVRYLHAAIEPSREGPGVLRIWMEYAPGGSLERAIRKHAKLTLGFTTLRVCAWVVQLADALDHMHTRRVLHRDLKTANVFLMHTGDVKLGDFGVARSFSTHTHLAQTQAGTPDYMGPPMTP